MARRQGPKTARMGMLKIPADPRVPMMQIYDLYRGELQPEDVLAAARADNPPADVLNYQLFYAHLYLGLYYDASGQREQALPHIAVAEEHKIDHYMWDVAHVHGEVLRKAAAGSEK
jgi:lipoprotein NlpI